MLPLDWEHGQREREWGALRSADPCPARRAAQHAHPEGSRRRARAAGRAAPRGRLPRPDHPPRPAEATVEIGAIDEAQAQPLPRRARIRADRGRQGSALRRSTALKRWLAKSARRSAARLAATRRKRRSRRWPTAGRRRCCVPSRRARSRSPSSTGVISSLSYPSLERRLAAMRLAGLIEARPGNGRGTPYAVTDWLRRGIARWPPPSAGSGETYLRHRADRPRSMPRPPSCSPCRCCDLPAEPVRLLPHWRSRSRTAGDGTWPAWSSEVEGGRIAVLRHAAAGQPATPGPSGSAAAWLGRADRADTRRSRAGRRLRSSLAPCSTACTRRFSRYRSQLESEPLTWALRSEMMDRIDLFLRSGTTTFIGRHDYMIQSKTLARLLAMAVAAIAGAGAACAGRRRREEPKAGL